MWIDFVPVVCGAFLAAVVSSSAGFAFAVVASGIWMHVLTPAEVVLLASICATFLHGATLWRCWREIEFSLMWPFLIGALPGVPIGVYALHHVNPVTFRDLFGFFMIAYATYMLRRPTLPQVHLPAATARASDAMVGLAGGAMGGVAMLHGILPTIWCGLRGWNKRRSRFVYQPYIFLTGIYVMLLVGSSMNVPDRSLGLHLLGCVPALLLGMWAGMKVFDLISEKVFQRAVLWLILLSGVALLL